MIIGHQKIIRFLDKSIENQSLSHAYLFSGPEHVGKFAVAKYFAAKLAGREEDINPDIIILSPEIEEKKGIIKKKDITVEAIRELQKKLSVYPVGKHKIAVIDDADFLNKSAQNALLKTLEEPPAGVIIILVVQNTAKIFPTIFSRCQTKKFSLVSDNNLEKIIPPDCPEKEEIVFWSLGCPGTAKIMSENREKLEERRKNYRELYDIISQNMTEKFSLAEEWSKDTNLLISRLSWWLVVLRDCFLGDGIKKIKLTPEKALKITEKIEEAIEVIKNTNSNPRLVMENLFTIF
ncbi:MAG TPA: AAA family ATPase [Candidatus Moranbacteria bacterium]|nr:AAA family ATPase [Candidatus Moranbacteria bacterium]